jgi:hypothetical protein
VGGLDEPQAPVLDIWNSSTSKFKFEQVRVVRGAHEYRLLFEQDAFLSMGENLLADCRNLSILVGTSDETRAHPGVSVRCVKYNGEALWRFSSHTIGHVKNLLARSVIGAENYRPGPRKRLFEVQNVPRFSSTERVDGLRIVANDRDSFVGSAQRLQEFYLQSIHVLVLVNEYVIERAR